jgi:hypothetical protein
MIKKLIIPVTIFFMITGLSIAFASHHYHGGGCMMSTKDMSAMDTNEDNELSFEEFSEPHLESLRTGFDMVDANKDGKISQIEWKNLLRVHGIKTE